MPADNDNIPQDYNFCFSSIVQCWA